MDLRRWRHIDAANPSHTYTVAGPYQARLTVSDGVNSTLSPPLSISAGNRPVVRPSTTLRQIMECSGRAMSSPSAGRDRRGGRHAAGQRLYLEHRLPPRGPRSSGYSHHRRNQRHLHDPDLRARLQRLHAISHHADGHRFQRAAIGSPSTVFPERSISPSIPRPPGLTLYLDGIAHTAPFVYDTLGL